MNNDCGQKIKTKDDIHSLYQIYTHLDLFNKEVEGGSLFYTNG